MSLILFVVTFLIKPSLCQKWTDFPDTLVQISARGNELWALGVAGQIYRWGGTCWEQKGGNGSAIAATADGHAYHLDYQHKIWKWNNGGWYHLSGSLVQISAFSKDLFIGVNSDGEIYEWAKTGWANHGNKAKWASIGENGEKWMIGQDGSISRWENGQFAKVPGNEIKGAKIDVHSPSHVIMTDIDNMLYIWRKGKWQYLNQESSSATITQDKIYTIVPYSSKVKVADFLDCKDTSIIIVGVGLGLCSISKRQTVSGVNAEQCCDLCRNVTLGGGCFFENDHNNATNFDGEGKCHMCDDTVDDELSMKAAIYRAK